VIFLKKLYALVVLLLCSSILFSSAIITTHHNYADTVNADYHKVFPTIIIDPGHGGFDGGACDSTGYAEKHINLSVSLYLSKYLELLGFETILTRDKDTSLENSDADTIRSKKTSDLHNRMKIMEQTHNCIFISIHQNIYSVEKYNGMQVFYSPFASEQSSLLAQSIQENTVNLIQHENTRQIKKCGTSVYLIYKAIKPACLVECGFLSNNKEAEKLKTEVYQKQLAFSIAVGIQQYLYKG
jgi:N-acetylmuramoyl-L-alanine amidase